MNLHLSNKVTFYFHKEILRVSRNFQRGDFMNFMYLAKVWGTAAALVRSLDVKVLRCIAMMP